MKILARISGQVAVTLYFLIAGCPLVAVAYDEGGLVHTIFASAIALFILILGGYCEWGFYTLWKDAGRERGTGEKGT